MKVFKTVFLMLMTTSLYASGTCPLQLSASAEVEPSQKNQIEIFISNPSYNQQKCKFVVRAAIYSKDNDEVLSYELIKDEVVLESKSNKEFMLGDLKDAQNSFYKDPKVLSFECRIEHQSFIDWCMDITISSEELKTVEAIKKSAGAQDCFEISSYLENLNTKTIKLDLLGLKELSPLIVFEQFPHIREISLAVSSDTTKKCPLKRSKRCKFINRKEKY